jgi:hypothetical protein
MRYIDTPDLGQIRTLAGVRADACVSLWLRTTPVTANVEASRIDFRNLLKEAMRQIESAGVTRQRAIAIAEFGVSLESDDAFWEFQSESLAVFITPEFIRTYRLPNHFASGVELSDRFHIAPLVRAVSFPHIGYVLCLSQNNVRLIEITESAAVDVTREAGIPESLSDALGRSMPHDPAPSGRLQGGEGQKVLVQKFARGVDAAVRAYLAGGDSPVIVAAVDHVASIYRSVSGYSHLLDDRLDGNFDRATPAEIAERARPLLGGAHEREAAAGIAEFRQKHAEGRGLTDLADIARAATQGAVHKLWISVDAVVHGTMDENGGIVLADAPGPATYDLVGESAARASIAGGEVIGLRGVQMPDGAVIAAILRYVP